MGYKPPLSGNNIADTLAGMFTAEDVKNLEGFADMMSSMQQIFQDRAEKEDDSQFLLNILSLSHKDMKKFVDEFSIIGKFNLSKTNERLGSTEHISDFEELANHFDNLEQHIEEENNRQANSGLKITKEWFEIERLVSDWK